MATISAATNEKVYSIPKWLGLNEHPDGDTRLKLGEASKMVNWKITRDGNLKRRPGTETIFGLCSSYTVGRIPESEPIKTYASGDETIEVFTGVTASSPNGKLTLYGDGGVVQKGIWSDAEAGISDISLGTLTGAQDSEDPPNEKLVLQNGVLSVAGNDGTIYTIADLQTALASLEEGEYLYVQNEEAVYALDTNSLLHTGNEYSLSGYLLYAKPSSKKPVTGLWSGVLAGQKVLLAACDGNVWNLYDDSDGTFKRDSIGALNTNNGVHFFMFDGIVYVLNGVNYYKIHDGGSGLILTKIDHTNSYVPLVAIAIGPVDTADAGELTGEYVNLLSNKRRVWLSPDGTNKVFQLPEKNLKAITSIVSTTDGSTISGWTGNTTNGTVTFTSAPARAVNSMEVEYSVYLHTDTGHSSVPDYYGQVASNLFSELYSGTTDTRIFIYGNGTNKALYSGMDSNGMPRADYFPDQYEVAVGDSNTPLTAMVRHGGTLVAFKPNECWSIQHGIIELANANLTPALYCAPVNRDRGNVSPGQVCLVNNSPVTTSGTELYQWTNSSYYTSNLTRDERQARRISDRIQSSIKEVDFETCRMWDDNDGQEFYLFGNNFALVWNYAADVWYRYNDFDVSRMCNFMGDLYIGTSDGFIKRMTYERYSDSGKTIQAEWESGAIDFGAGHLRKYSSTLWVGLKPADGTSVDVCVETDRKNTFLDKVVSSTKAKIPGQPFMARTKIKAKKFVYYRLLLSVKEKIPAVTVTNVEFRVRTTGYAK